MNDLSGGGRVLASNLGLDWLAPFRDRRACLVCDGGALRFDIVDFNKFCSAENFYGYGFSSVMVPYWRCERCGYVFTDFFARWSPEDFRAHVYNADYIKVDREYASARPEHVAHDFATRRLAGCEGARVLDFGSGAGVFVERMREQGFTRIEAYDPFSRPERPHGVFDIVTCFEVLEHSPDPVQTLAEIRGFLADDGCIIFSQTLQPPDILSLRGNWWYLAPRNGHISTFTEESLVQLGRRHGLVLHSADTVHAFATSRPSILARRALSRVGPSVATLTLLAPRPQPHRNICFPGPDDMLWGPVRQDGAWDMRWTGGTSVAWAARWGEIASLHVRVPYLREAAEGFAGACTLALGDVCKPVTISRGGLMAAFDVAGLTAGVITLNTPEPVVPPWIEHGRGAVGLAIPADREPNWERVNATPPGGNGLV